MPRETQNSLAETYISLVGERDSNTRGFNSYNDQLVDVSQQCGQLCVDIASGREEGFRSVSRALERIKDNQQEKAYWRDRAHLMGLSIEWLDRRQDPGGLSEVQDKLQEETCLQLDKAVEHLPNASYRAKPHLLGRITELTSIALINFLRDPTLVALPALPHHERSPSTKDNYDIVLLHANNGYPKVQQVQVKLGCQSFCENPTANPHKENARVHYSKDIAIISGHCDLGITNDRNNNASCTASEALLKAEFDPVSISDSEIDELCSASDQILEALTGQTLEERTGKSSSPNWQKPRRWLKAA
jgi:hypothetical protein